MTVEPGETRDDPAAWRQLPMIDGGGGAGPADAPAPASGGGKPAATRRKKKAAGAAEGVQREDGGVTGKTDRTKDAAEGPGLEESLRRLEAIVRELEGGSVDLDRSLVLFEEGVALTRSASRRLTEAEAKIARLVRTLDGGFLAEPIEDAADRDEER